MPGQLTCLGAVAPGGTIAARLAAVPESVGEARGLTAAACARWRIPIKVSGRIQVVVSELVSNSVQHARTPLELVLRRTSSYVHVTVSDGDKRPARLREPRDPLQPGGRGLVLVEAFAAAWGCHPHAGGKSTWATIRYRARRPGPPVRLSPR